jgi:hypothetical protein
VIAKGYNMLKCIKKQHGKLLYYFEKTIPGFALRHSGKPPKKKVPHDC